HLVGGVLARVGAAQHRDLSGQADDHLIGDVAFPVVAAALVLDDDHQAAVGAVVRGGRDVGGQGLGVPGEAANGPHPRAGAEVQRGDEQVLASVGGFDGDHAAIVTTGLPGGLEQMGTPEPARQPSAIVDELQRYVEIGLLQHRDDGLQIVALLGAYPDLVALDLRLDALRSLLADQLGDLLGVLGADALFDGAGHLEGLAAGLRFAGLERLDRDVPAHQLLLEDIAGRLEPLLGRAGDLDGALALPRDAGVGAAEVEPGGQLLGRLVQRVVDFLPVDLADHVEA